MKCEVPGCQNEATVHEVVIKSGKKVERHLCEQHAQTEGIVVAHTPINELLTKFVMTQAGAQAEQTRPTECPTCASTWAEFREKGLLGCPDCYDTFEEQLSPLLSRAHEGATHHVGRTPKRAGISAGLHRELTSLRRELEDAIRAEEYEKAASIRDRIRKLHGEQGGERESKPTPPSPATPAERSKARRSGDANPEEERE